MKTIFRSESVSVIDDESGTDESLTVTVNTSMGQALLSLGCEIMRLKQENERLERLNKEQYEMLKEVTKHSSLVRSKSSSMLVPRGVALPSEPQYYKVPLHVVSVINGYINGLTIGDDL